MGGEPGRLERLIGLKPKKARDLPLEDRQYFSARKNVYAVYQAYTDRRADSPGLMVYFISCPGNRIKIGYSIRPEKRLRSLQTGMPFKLTLLGYVPGGPTLEKMLHAHFAKHRVAGEWFKATPGLMREVSLLLDLWAVHASHKKIASGIGE